jgi:hypothetical protein
MENAIQKIIKKIPKGKVFDSHYVISQLIAEHSDEYLVFASELINSQKPIKRRNITAYVHSQISKKIGEFDSVVRVKLDDEKTKFRSENIRRKASECAGWRKL